MNSSLQSAPFAGTLAFVPVELFSSSLCDRTMLRRPSFCQCTPREEGCSSTAIAPRLARGPAVWDNLAYRGSAGPLASRGAAVP